MEVKNGPTSTGVKKDQRGFAKVSLVRCISPDCLFFRLASQNALFKQITEHMEVFYGQKARNSEWLPTRNDSCAVFYGDRWCRGVILDQTKDKVKVHRRDYVDEVDVDVHNVQPLDERFTSLGNPAKCKLAGILPFGETWSKEALLMLKLCLEKFADKLQLTQKGAKTLNTLPVELRAKVAVVSPLSPSEDWTIDFAEYLVEIGVAVHHEEERIPGCDIRKWLPALPLKDTVFHGKATYVDMDCNIFIHDLVEHRKNLGKIRKTYKRKYLDSNPRPQDSFYFPGQMCAAKFRDNRWYRARVLEAKTETKFEVQFVDYGNIEECQLDDLRADIDAEEANMPIQTWKCHVDGLKSKGATWTWTIDMLDFVHAAVVDHKVRVEVQRTPTHEDDTYGVIVKYLSGESLEEYLNGRISESPKNMEHLSNGSRAGKNVTDNNTTLKNNPWFNHPIEVISNKFYKFKSEISNGAKKNLPVSDEWFVKVIGIKSSNECVLQVLDVPDEPEWKELSLKFDMMMKNIQEDIKHQSAIEHPSQGHFCYALMNGHWYRAEIVSCGEMEPVLTIVLVDSGCLATVPACALRTANLKWMDFRDFPKVGLSCILSNIIKSPKFSTKRVCDRLSTELFNKIWIARIVERDPLSVELYENDFEDAHSVKMAYQSMMDENLLLEKDTF